MLSSFKMAHVEMSSRLKLAASKNADSRSCDTIWTKQKQYHLERAMSAVFSHELSTASPEQIHTVSTTSLSRDQDVKCKMSPRESSLRRPTEHGISGQHESKVGAELLSWPATGTHSRFTVRLLTFRMSPAGIQHRRGETICGLSWMGLLGL